MRPSLQAMVVGKHTVFERCRELDSPVRDSWRPLWSLRRSLVLYNLR